jgi:hypothetical protein
MNKIFIILKKNSKLIFFYFFLSLVIFQIFKTPYNIYSIQVRSLDERLQRAYGYCSPYGYGFTRYIIDKYKIENSFPIYKNTNIFPGIYGIFEEHSEILNENEIIIIDANEIIDAGKNINKSVYDLEIINEGQKLNLKEYSLIEKKGNCFFFKND